MGPGRVGGSWRYGARAKRGRGEGCGAPGGGRAHGGHRRPRRARGGRTGSRTGRGLSAEAAVSTCTVAGLLPTDRGRGTDGGRETETRHPRRSPPASAAGAREGWRLVADRTAPADARPASPRSPSRVRPPATEGVAAGRARVDPGLGWRRAMTGCGATKAGLTVLRAGQLLVRRGRRPRTHQGPNPPPPPPPDARTARD